MIVRSWSVLAAIHLLLTVIVGNCQWTVDVQLYQFENKHNAEIDDGHYCCCDSSICADDLSELPSYCSERCDTWFDVKINPCAGTDQFQCSVSTERILNSPSVSEYGYIFRFTSNVQPENLSISMFDDLKGKYEIDRFVVSLSILSSTSLITSFTGENNISVIELSYQIRCINLDNCPNTLTSPEMSSIESCTSMAVIMDVIPTPITLKYTAKCTQLATIIKSVTVTNTNECLTGELSSPTLFALIATSGMLILLTTISTTVSIFLGCAAYHRKAAMKTQKACDLNNYIIQGQQSAMTQQSQGQELICSENIAYSSVASANKHYENRATDVQDDMYSSYM